MPTQNEGRGRKSPALRVVEQAGGGGGPVVADTLAVAETLRVVVQAGGGSGPVVADTSHVEGGGAVWMGWRSDGGRHVAC